MLDALDVDEGRELQRESVDLSRIVTDAVSDAHAAGRLRGSEENAGPVEVTVVDERIDKGHDPQDQHKRML